MRSPVDTILNAFLSRQPDERRMRLLAFLPDAERERLANLAAAAEAMTLENFSNGSMLERVHWSWFLPTLKSYSAKEQPFFLSALDEHAAAALSVEIPCKPSKQELQPAGKAYLRKVLLDSLIGAHDRLIPMEYLPPSPLNRILQLSKRQIIFLIDLLAMHDLAMEIRQIVETKILKKIYSFLTETQRKLLKQISAKPEPFSMPKIGLDRWDGAQESLRHMIHRRGLARLGIALSGQDPALIWYVCHQLDIGRGNALFKLCVREGSSAAVDAAVRQVDELLGHESL